MNSFNFGLSHQLSHGLLDLKDGSVFTGIQHRADIPR
jgi:hypothetical protein